MATRTIRVNREGGRGKGKKTDGVAGDKAGGDNDEVVEVKPSGDAEYQPTVPGGEGGPAGDGGGEQDEELTPTGRKKRKYGKRSGKGKREGETPENLTIILVHSHLMLAKLLDVPELMINEEEGKEFAAAIQRVNNLYDTEWISDELSAWINLGIAGVSIYGPRWIAYNARLKREKREGKRETPIDAPFVVNESKAQVG